jgi:hypothetical protein
MAVDSLGNVIPVDMVQLLDLELELVVYLQVPIFKSITKTNKDKLAD